LIAATAADASSQTLQSKAIYNSPLTFSKFYKKSISNTHLRSTRLFSNKFNLYLPRYKTNKLQRSYKYQGVKIWNSILDHL